MKITNKQKTRQKRNALSRRKKNRKHKTTKKMPKLKKKQRKPTTKKLKHAGKLDLQRNTQLNQSSYRRNQQNVEQSMEDEFDIENDNNEQDTTFDTFMSYDDEDYDAYDDNDEPYQSNVGPDAYESLSPLRNPDIYISYPYMVLNSYITTLYNSDLIRRIDGQDKFDFFVADIAEVLTFLNDIGFLHIMKNLLIHYTTNDNGPLPESVQRLLIPYRDNLNTHITNIENRMTDDTQPLPPFAMPL